MKDSYTVFMTLELDQRSKELLRVMEIAERNRQIAWGWLFFSLVLGVLHVVRFFV